MIEPPSNSWVKMMRSDETRELLADLPAFGLLAMIACRAQRTAAFNRYNLLPGQALIGDYKACGLSEQQYRTAKAKLADWNFATFKATNKGTIATLIDTRVFDINADAINRQINSPATDGQRTANGQSTTTKNGNNENKAKNLSKPIALNSKLTLDRATLGLPLKPEGVKLIELMEECKSVLGHDEMSRSDLHRRWYDRAKDHPKKLDRVLAETRVYHSEGKIKTTPAKFAESLWRNPNFGGNN